MARNDDNLKPLSTEKAREIGSKGGKASVEARRKKRDLRLALEALLESDVKKKDLSGKEQNMSVAEAMSLEQVRKALKGDSKAYEIVRDSCGQKPVDKIQVAEVDAEVISEVEKAVLED
jgi:transcriptional/translational regulatory protein YebC/TACO1